MTKNVFIAGHKGMVGNAIKNELIKQKKSIVTIDKNKLDLRDQREVASFFQQENINEVYLCAAKVGGILANDTYPADFIYDNLMIQTNIIHASYTNKIEKLLFLGSSCIYPRDCEQPMKEDFLLNGQLEKTNEAYAVAKIAGIKTCQSYNKQYGTNFRSVMPTNLYGPGDNFNPKESHVVPGLIMKFHKAKIQNLKEVVIWGTGKPKRELLFVQDLAKACIYVMENESKFEQSDSLVNIGSNEELTIYELAVLVKEITNYQGDIVFDESMPDGTPRKLLDSSKILNLGWKPQVSLKEGLVKTYDWFLNNSKSLRH